MIDHGSHCEAVVGRVLQNIYDREALIERLEKLHRSQSANRPPHPQRVQRLLYGLHNASLAVVEAIDAWNVSKQNDWYRRKTIDIHSSSLQKGCNDTSDVHVALGRDVPCPFHIFFHKGRNYLHKMLSDLDFVGEITEAISFLGPVASFHRNPFLLTLNVDELGGPINSQKVASVWKDVNMVRFRRAAFVILWDEYNRNGCSSQLATGDARDEITCLRNAVSSAKFRPPDLKLKDIEAYTGMLDPPATVAVPICCAHLVLRSVKPEITDKLVYLTKAIVLQIFHQPLNRLIQLSRIYNPLNLPDKNMNNIRLVYPFVMHPKLDPEHMAGISDQIVYLVLWLRALVSRLVEEKEIPSKTLSVADRIIQEVEADSQRGDNRPAKLLPKDGQLPNDANKENECALKSVAVQTDINSPHKVRPCSNQLALEAVLGGRPESRNLIPSPVAITVNLREGDTLVSVNGDIKDARILNTGDVVRICDAHESSNWTIASAPTTKDNGLIVFQLGSVYDHSRIVAQQTKATHDTLNRLCYPYKKTEGGASIYKPLEVLSSINDRTRHVACDANEIIHSPLHIKKSRLWKLIPEEEDTRTAWRREYDSGEIPWENDAAGSNRTHFRVCVDMGVIEQSCVDSPYPLRTCVHQQRVNFFENVQLMDVINEAFHTLCRWHPKGTLIDNVKWAKLSRKMNFLSNVKNSKHEIDMAFVRHNQDRKLDLARFHAIFADIASIQYPSLSKRDALSRVVWSSIVMLPDVNTRMWKVAKEMAINAEAKRVCAQIRISAVARKNLQRKEYLKAKCAAIVVSKHVRRFLAHIFVGKILKATREDESYQRRWRCAKIVQTAWRRFFWRNRFILHKERKIEEKMGQISATRAKLREMRQRERASIVFRDVIRIDSVIATVVVSFHDDSYLQDENSMLIKVYVPITKETFSFNLEENAIKECLEKALSSRGRLSWDEMLKDNALKELTRRLMLRVVRGRPIILFSRRNVVEKGVLKDRRVVRAVGELFILSTFRSPHNFVFYTYQPSTQLQMKINLPISKLCEWLRETQKQDDQSESVCLLNPKRQTELVEWLVVRVVIRKHPQGENLQLLLQSEAEHERVINLITKVQAHWRRIKSLHHAKELTIQLYEKVYIREPTYCEYAYRNIRTDQRQWAKPKLLGDDDFDDPIDEWRTEERLDPITGQKQQYYANYATGQSSWFSEEDAARLVQRRYRSKHESDLLGKNIQLPDIVKAMKFIHGTRTNYEQDPCKLSNIVNFALMTHCLDLDFEKAKPLFALAVSQSPNHPLISRAYGIFLLASRQTPINTTFQTACRFFHEANVVDPTQSKFQSAAEIYFRWAVLVDSKNPLALLNFALLHQCIYKKYNHAEKIYRAALALDPVNSFVVENYHLFTNQRYPPGEYSGRGPPYSVVRDSEIVEERLEWAEWTKRSHVRGLFWFNRFTKETRFHEPDWKYVLEARMKRSKCVSGKATQWVEYWDERTKTTFWYDSAQKKARFIPA